MTWEKYFNGKLIKRCENFFIIKNECETQPHTPLICPVCEYVMRTKEDEQSYRNFSCCENCELIWARPNQKKWSEGWRPSTLELQEKSSNKIMNVTINF